MTYPKTDMEAISLGYQLYESWCSRDKKVDLTRVKATIRQEIAWTKQWPARMTVRLLNEIKRDLRVVSFIQNRYPELFVTRSHFYIDATTVK